ncbi:hypothetical protein [Archaeoglobus veneficus]|uniref:CARDB domain-containing protein n=1 Tax=Archaeoglobus veneficus (strain DSM 11195 / SNP6) TaxID=693661 RepID=F2KRQ9_ARCVS|nr:hypothetical protein [Archaeoglobus veneficus]AEA47923.1 hypothetical protein Arcve_1930 [Archaeoglobus veneficus SNP6]
MKRLLLALLTLLVLLTLTTPASAHIVASVELRPSVLLPGDTAYGTLTLTNKGTTSIKVTGVTFFSDLKVEPKSISSIGYIPPAGSYELPFRINAEKVGLYTVEAHIYTTNGTLKQIILIDVRDLMPEIVLTSAITLNEVNTVQFTLSDPIGVSNVKIEPLFDAEPKVIYLSDSEGVFTYYASEKKELSFKISFYNGENYHEIVQTITPEYRESKGVLLNVSLPYNVVPLKDVVPVKVEITNLRNDAIYSIQVTVKTDNFTKTTQIASLNSMGSSQISFLCPAEKPGEQTILICVSYRDCLNNEYSTEKHVSVQILNEKAVVVSNIDVEWDNGLKISGDVSNSGKSKVYNVMLALLADRAVKTYYLGTIDPSDFDTFEFTAENVTSAKLLVTWNNELGEKVEEVLPLEIPSKPEFRTQSSPAVIVVSVVVLVIVVAIVAIAWVRRR